MTATIRPPALPGRRDGWPPEGALVRVVADPRDGVRAPPAPAGTDVTVSFSCAAAAGHAPALEAVGYRCVGVAPTPGSSEPAADFLVPQTVIDRHPRWWACLNEDADRVFRLAFGPALAAWDEVLHTHR